MAASDLVVSAGGTMNREAAALGVPAYTPFAARLGAVDRRLIAEGRLRRLEDPADVLLERRRARRAAPVARPRGAPRPDSRRRTVYTAPPVRSAPLNWSPRAFAHRGAQIAVDTGLVAAAYWLAFYFRFDGNVPGRYERLFAGTVLIVVVIKLATFVAMRFYTKWWRFTSLRDLQAIVLAAAVSSLLVAAILSNWRPGDLVAVPRGVLVFDLVLTLTFIGGARFAVRSVIERPPRSELVSSGREVLICGAGDAGNTLLREMKRNRELGYTPVGLIDDDPRKRRLRVQGTRVRGTRADLPRRAARGPRRRGDHRDAVGAGPGAPGDRRGAAAGPASPAPRYRACPS